MNEWVNGQLVKGGQRPENVRELVTELSGPKTVSLIFVFKFMFKETHMIMVFDLLPAVRFPNRARYLSHLLGSLEGAIRRKVQFRNAPIKMKKSMLPHSPACIA
jgi:hypothetical protein